MVFGLAMVHLLGATKKTTTSGGTEFFLILIVAFALIYYFFLRPNRRKQQARQAEQRAFEVGDLVVTIGGIVGRVVDATDDRVTIITAIEDEETAGVDAGTRLVFVRSAIARRLEPTVDEDNTDEHDDDEEHDHDHDDHDHDDHDEQDKDEHS